MFFKKAMRIEHRAQSIQNSNVTTSTGFVAQSTKQILSVFFITLFIIFFAHFALCALLYADIRDRVVASVDNDAITLSELDAKYEETLKVTPAITKEEVLTTMVNRLLLLDDAKKMRLEASTEDVLLKEYIDLKIRSLIRIKEEEIKDFYEKHVNEFQGKELDDVRDDIEKYLTEKEVNKRLKAHINELREESCVRIQLK
jgi:hypothetical protein